MLCSRFDHITGQEKWLVSEKGVILNLTIFMVYLLQDEHYVIIAQNIFIKCSSIDGMLVVALK